MAYRTVNAVNIIQGIGDLGGLDRNNISGVDFQQIRQSMDRRLQTAWEFDMWPELERTEKRYFRNLYSSATTYTASTATVPTEVFFPATGKYYQNVKGSTGVDPANGAGVVNSTNWAESANSYDPPAFNAATTYSVGNQVYYSTTDRSYVLHTAAVAGTLPTDTTKWGILTDFDAYVAYQQTGLTAIGSVFCVSTSNPKTTTRNSEVNWWLSDNGVQVASLVAWVWIVYRIRTVRLSGDNFDADTVYVGGTDQVYYSSATAPGNWYDCVTTTTAGQTPESTPAKWSVVNIPLMFQRYMEMGGYSDYLRNTGQSEKSDVADAQAQALLSDQSFLLQGQQQQVRRTVVLTR